LKTDALESYFFHFWMPNVPVNYDKLDILCAKSRDDVTLNRISVSFIRHLRRNRKQRDAQSTNATLSQGKDGTKAGLREQGCPHPLAPPTGHGRGR
jgi:hypothetical protein